MIQAKYNKMSRCSLDNYVIISENTITKYSPKKYIDFSIELEYSAIKYLRSVGINNIPTIIDYTFDPQESESSIEMERIMGPLLYEVLDEQLTPNEAYYLMLNILYSLAEFHDNGVTHGDIHGENIILLAVDEEINKWKSGGEIIEVPSLGYKPMFIDFGFSYIPKVKFKPDLGTTHAGALTSLTPNKQGDIIALFETMAANRILAPILRPILAFLPDGKNIPFVAVDEKITRHLKNHQHARKNLYKFFSAELYNLLRCFPFTEIVYEPNLDQNMERFIKFLKTNSTCTCRELCEKVKEWHFQKHAPLGIRAGAAVINHFIKIYIPEAKAAFKLYADKFALTNITDAIVYIKESQNKILND